MFVDNDDLRVRYQEFFFHPYLGYQQVANRVTVRPHQGYTSHVGVDSAGFVHTGDPDRNRSALSQPKGKSYRVVFLGGSTMFGLGASSNVGTIPAYFEKLLRRAWPGVDFLVLNAGVQGYQSTQERVRYELDLAGLDPDLVVLLDGTNDAMLAADLPQWQPHPILSSVMNNARWVALQSPTVNLANALRSVVSFPEPLASLALLRRGLSRLPLDLGGERHDFPAYYHPEAARQLRDNLRALAVQLSAEKRLGLFMLQPYLGAAKGGMSDLERQIVAGYGARLDVFNRHFGDFEKVYADLDEDYAPRSIRFVNQRNLFAQATTGIYQSLAHYDDVGNQAIAQAMFDEIQAGLLADLRGKGLLP